MRARTEEDPAPPPNAKITLESFESILTVLNIHGTSSMEPIQVFEPLKVSFLTSQLHVKRS